MARHRRRRISPLEMAKLKKRSDEASDRLREIYGRYTTEAIVERLGPREGGWSDSDLKTAIKAETDKMFAEYHQVERDYDLPYDSLTDVAMECLHGMERVLSHPVVDDGDDQHRMRS